MLTRSALVRMRVCKADFISPCLFLTIDSFLNKIIHFFALEFNDRRQIKIMCSVC